MNNIDINNLRIEIAILQESIPKTHNGEAEFKIPIIMSTRNELYNNNIKLYVPREYIYFYDGDIIPSGTKFLVTFVGGNINNPRIIGRYYE